MLNFTYSEPAADDSAAIARQRTRSDVISRDPLACRIRSHSGCCVVETLSDGSARHVETFAQTKRVYVMTRQGLRS